MEIWLVFRVNKQTQEKEMYDSGGTWSSIKHDRTRGRLYLKCELAVVVCKYHTQRDDAHHYYWRKAVIEDI